MSLFPTPVVVRPLLYRETDVMLTVMNAIFKTLYLLLCKQIWKNQEKNNNKLLNIVPHLPPSLSLTSVSISSVKKKKDSPCTKIWECIWTASLYSMYVCVSQSTSNKLTWYYGRLSHFSFPFVCKEWQVGLGFPKWGCLSSSPSECLCFILLPCFYVGCLFVTTLNTHNNVK